MESPAPHTEPQNRVLTVPNILTVFRLLLIPVILWFALARQQYLISAILLVVSGITDIVDGFIARHFRMVSNVGRILDPVADKLTQLATLACLCVRYVRLAVPLAVLAVKELANGIIALVMLRYHRQALDSQWHGKAATVLLYATIFAHFVWEDIPAAASFAMIAACLGLMVLSFVLYTLRNVKIIRARKEEREEADRTSAPDRP